MLSSSKQNLHNSLRKNEINPLQQMLISKNIKGDFFAFVPTICKLYKISPLEAEKAGFIDKDQDYKISNISLIPEIENEYFNFISSTKENSILRKHPPGIALIVTQSCNLSCSYCLAKKGTFGLPISNLSFDEIKNIIKSLFSIYPDIAFIKFFGGEPTLRLDIIEKVCHFVTDTIRKPIRFAITTNGTQDPRKHIDLWKHYHVNVSVSIDGPKHIHDSQRVTNLGKGSFDLAKNYCSYLQSAKFPFAVVGVFDERHINNKFTYLDLIKFLNKFSPVSKVQFVEALGDAGSGLNVASLSPNEVKLQIYEAVDQLYQTAINNWLSSNSRDWLYDNNIFRFIYGVIKEKAKPYEHTCTASNLTTIMPSGDLMPCYTLSENKSFYYGSKQSNFEEVENKRKKYRDKFSWENLSQQGVTAPWYRGIVGDVCVADMINSNQDGLESSQFYQTFQLFTSLRVLQNISSLNPGSFEHARLMLALREHEKITGMFSSASL